MRTALWPLLGVLLALAACGDAPTDEPALGLAGALRADGDYSTLVSLASQTGVLATLEGSGPFTVFAPTNLAFVYLGADIAPILTERAQNDVLARVLRHHVVPGRIDPDDLADGDVLTSLDGATLTVRRLGDVVLVDGVRVELADRVEAENGVAYATSDVIRTNLTSRERITLSPSLRTFARLATQSGVLARAEALGGATVLVPTDDAFSTVGGTLTLLEQPGNSDVLRQVLSPHVIPGRVDLSSLPDGATVETADGLTLQVTNDNGVLRVGGVRVLREAVETADGAIYLMGGVLFKGITLANRMRVQPSLSIFPARIQRESDVWARLRDSDDALTVFAPTDGVYIRQNGDVVLELQQPQNATLAARTLRVLVVEGRFEPDDLQQGMVLQALDGSELPVQRDGSRIFVGGRLVTPTGAESSNGVLYTADDFIRPRVDPFDSAILYGYTAYARLIRRAGLESFFRQETLSLFPPTNGAINETQGLAFAPPAEVEAILRFHASVADLPFSLAVPSVTMIDGSTRTIVIVGGQGEAAAYLDGVARVVDARSAFNGQGKLFAVDSLVRPPG